MAYAHLAGLLQAASTNSTAAGTSVPSLWVTLVELAIALGVISVAGTLLTRVVRRVATRAGASRSVINSMTQWMGVLMLLAAVAVVTTFAGLSSYLTALTISGIAGLAVSLALQNTVSNVISGVLLQHDGVIRLGDDIQYGQGGVRGEVVNLSLRTTWLKTKDGVLVMIGNSNLASGPILNYSAMERFEKKESH